MPFFKKIIVITIKIRIINARGSSQMEAGVRFTILQGE